MINKYIKSKQIINEFLGIKLDKNKIANSIDEKMLLPKAYAIYTKTLNSNRDFLKKPYAKDFNEFSKYAEACSYATHENFFIIHICSAKFLKYNTINFEFDYNKKLLNSYFRED